MQLQCEKRLKILSVYVSKSLFLFFSTEIFRGIFETFCVFEIFCDIWIFFFFFSEFLERYFKRFYEIRYLWKGLEGHKMTQGSPREGFIIIILVFF